MKKCILFLIALLLAILCSCNDSTFYKTYNYAIIKLPNGEIIEGEIEKYSILSNNGQIMIIMNGIPYLVHGANAVLIGK